jgi:hypothetical protein
MTIAQGGIDVIGIDVADMVSINWLHAWGNAMLRGRLLNDDEGEDRLFCIEQ